MDSKFQRVNTEEFREDGGEETIYEPKENWRIWKNVLILGFAFMLHFTAFWGASNLQSSINSDESLGTFTLASIYGSLILSNLLLPSFVIKHLGCKWTVCLSLIAYMPFIGAQFYPKFSTMIPAGLAVGLGGGPLWCAKCTYLTIISKAYARVTKIQPETAMTIFFGVFFMFYQFSQVWGNLISSAVLSSGSSTPISPVNQTSELFSQNISQLLAAVAEARTDAGGVAGVCGADFCPGAAVATANPNLERPEAGKVQLIAGIYLACMVLATLIVGFGMDSMERYSKEKKGDIKTLSTFKLLAATLRHLSNPYQIMIIPIMMFIGAEQAFLAADFTAAFVSCGWGIENIGFVMICFGVCNGIASSAIGGITKMIGRNLFVCCSLALHVTLIIILLVWQPNSQSKYIYFLLSGLWGLCDAIWLVQLSALTGTLFVGKEEASYSHFRLWESLGSVVTYAYSPYLCVSVKLYLLLTLLLLGVSGYTLVEYFQYKKEARTSDDVTSKGTFSLIDNLKTKDELRSI